MQYLPTGQRRAAHFERMSAAFLLHVDNAMAGKTIQAAGGIVMRNRARTQIAVVQRAKDELWVLPRGKLKRDESALAGARREVVEETGHRVRVCEFVGAITYRARGRSKVVQFWRMQAEASPSRDLMEDIMAVEWLPLSAAVRKLSYPLERLFLSNVGRNILRARRKNSQPKSQIEITSRPVKGATPVVFVPGAEIRKTFGAPRAGNHSATRSWALEIRRPAPKSPQALPKFNLGNPAPPAIPNGPFRSHSRAKPEPPLYAVC